MNEAHAVEVFVFGNQHTVVTVSERPNLVVWSAPGTQGSHVKRFRKQVLQKLDQLFGQRLINQ